MCSSRDEMRASGRLAGEALAKVTGIVADTHTAVLRRVDRFLPRPAQSVSHAHHVIADGVYGGVAAGVQAIAHASAVATELTRGPDAAPLSQTSWGQIVLPAVNGLWGDIVAERHPELAVRMAIRSDGHDLPVIPAAIDAAFPDATSTLVVFVHGLGESERAWQLRLHNAQGEDALPYGDRLQADLGLTPVYLRYNSGLRVSANGLTMSRLLDDLVAAWPVPVERLYLVGHSMGGLVSRSACHQGDARGAEWPGLVRAVVTLGSPHFGAPTEQVVHAGEWMLRRLPEAEPLSRLLGSRSVGIHDLRYGSLVEEDWRGRDPSELLRDYSTDVPFLPHATYYFVAATITTDPEHPLGRLVGDGLVRYPSAAGVGRTRRTPLQMDDGAHIVGTHHLALLHHPSVYARLREWLDG